MISSALFEFFSSQNVDHGTPCVKHATIVDRSSNAVECDPAGAHSPSGMLRQSEPCYVGGIGFLIFSRRPALGGAIIIPVVHHHRGSSAWSRGKSDQFRSRENGERASRSTSSHHVQRRPAPSNMQRGTIRSR
jgi:hypothetical protein